MTHLDASAFKFSKDSHLTYLKVAYKQLIQAYFELLKDNYNVINENRVRDDLVKIAEMKKSSFFWVTEYPNIQKANRIDIILVTPNSLEDKNSKINIECKIVGEDKYIDTKNSFNRKNSPTNGLMSFITGKYGSKMPLAGMIGFIKQGDINDKISKIKERLKKHQDILTMKNLTEYNIIDKFDYSYHSKHKRDNKLENIEIYHLFFDFAH